MSGGLELNLLLNDVTLVAHDVSSLFHLYIFPCAFHDSGDIYMDMKCIYLYETLRKAKKNEWD